MPISLPKQITIREMAPRDGLQAISKILTTEQKTRLIKALMEAGCRYIQVTSFAHPKLVPQFADAEKLLNGLQHPPDVFYWATIPNFKGLERALDMGLDGISIPLSVTDGYSIVNLRQTKESALLEAEKVAARARKANLHVTASATAVYGCPIEGRVPQHLVMETFRRFEAMGAEAISVGDTTGMANPVQVRRLLNHVTAVFPCMEIITHFHNSRGTGLANVLAAMEAGVTIHDCALGGSGGQPATSRKRYARGNTGNVCTEDLVGMLEEMGISTGLDLDRLIAVSNWFAQTTGTTFPGFITQAGPVRALWGGGKTYLDYFVNTFGYRDIVTDQGAEKPGAQKSENQIAP